MEHTFAAEQGQQAELGVFDVDGNVPKVFARPTQGNGGGVGLLGIKKVAADDGRQQNLQQGAASNVQKAAKNHK